MPHYYNNKNISCDTKNCIRCRNRFNCTQYITHLESKSMPQTSSIVNEVPSQKSIENYDLILENLESIKSQNTIIKEDINFLIEKLSKIDVFIDFVESRMTTSDNEDQSESGLVVSDINTDAVIFREKKNIFGKTKWVEDKK